MSLKTQAKVLRALQEQVVEPVGGTVERAGRRARDRGDQQGSARPRSARGRFREDLYFRLNVIPIFVPPLRERGDDILLLAEHFMAEFAREYGRRSEAVSTPAPRPGCAATAGRATSASCAT